MTPPRLAGIGGRADGRTSDSQTSPPRRDRGPSDCRVQPFLLLLIAKVLSAHNVIETFIQLLLFMFTFSLLIR